MNAHNLQLKFPHSCITRTTPTPVFSQRHCYWKLFWASHAFPAQLPLHWGKSECKCCVPSNWSPETHGLYVTCKTTNTCWEDTQSIMTENLLRLAQKTVLLQHQVAQNCTSCHSLSYQWISELLQMLSHVLEGAELPLYNLNLSLWDCQVFSPLEKSTVVLG